MPKNYFHLFIQQCVCKAELARGEWVCELPHKRGDGFCDPSNNYDHCGYDGGDCCDNTNEGWDKRCEVPWYQGVSRYLSPFHLAKQFRITIGRCYLLLP